MSEKNRAAVPEKQLDSLRAGTHKLCKQTVTNWNTFFVKNSSCGPVMLSHKQCNAAGLLISAVGTSSRDHDRKVAVTTVDRFAVCPSYAVS